MCVFMYVVFCVSLQCVTDVGVRTGKLIFVRPFH